MDCCTAFFLALSSCSYSLTLLNDGNLMQIIYAEQNPSEAENYYERLIVESVEVMDPSAPVNESEIFNYAEGAFLSGILSKDIEAVNCITD